jgi:hypothetical protein
MDVKVTQVAGPNNRVVDLSPCGPQPKGTTIELKVGRGGAAEPSGGGSGSSSGRPTPSCPPGEVPIAPGVNLCTPSRRA